MNDELGGEEPDATDVTFDVPPMPPAETLPWPGPSR